MKQVLQNIRSGEIYLAEVPIPTPKPGTVLVKTASSLVSAGTERMLVEFGEKSLVGKARSRPDLVKQVLDKARREGLVSTLEAAFNRLDQPMVLGYSSAGEIVALGEGVKGFQIGQRVACAGGGYAVHAEYAIVPQNLMAVIPARVSFDQAAFSTLGAIAMHGFRLTEAKLGEHIAVIGLGLLGLLAAGIAKAAGCLVMGIDIDPDRVDLAGRIGIEAVQRESAEDSVIGFSRNRGVDAVLICADTESNDPVELAGVIARDRAKVVATGAVGLKIPRKIYYEKEISIINSRSYGPGRYDRNYEEAGQDYPIGYVRWTEGRNLEAFVGLLANGQINVDPLISHRFPIGDAPQAYELITGKKQEAFLGVLLTYPQMEHIGTLPKRVELFKPGAFEKISSEQVTVGVLGAGNFAATVMLPIMHKIPSIKFTGIASPSGINAQHAARRFGFSFASSDELQVIDNPDTQVVAVFTRHNLHARQTIAALNAGKSVFCEKPLAITPSELSELEDTLKKLAENDRSPLLMVGFNRRFAPLARQVAGFFNNRREPLVIYYRVNAGYIPLSHWVHDPLQGGGRLIGEGCHFIDFITFLVGSLPVSVCIQAMPDMGKYNRDNFTVTLSFDDGSLGTINYLANGDKSLSKEYIEIFCEGKVAVLEDFRRLTTVEKGRRNVIRSFFRQDKGHRGEWEAFISAFQTDRLPPIPYDHLIGVTQISFNAMKGLTEKP